MRVLIVAAAAVGLVLAATPASADTRRLALPGFDRMRIDGPVVAEVSSGRGTSVVVEGTAAAIDALGSRVDGRLLVLRATEPVRVRITTGAVDGVTLGGPVRFTIDRMRGDRLRVVAQGSARLEAGRVEADRLDLVASGSSVVRVAGGRVRAATVMAQGSAAIDAPALQVADLTLASEGDGAVALAASGTARINAEGAGSIAVGGSANCQVVRRGGGEVRCGR